MKVHYFNILLFALPLNILVSSPKKNPSITQKRPTTRLLCECELYSPANYNNDPQMKSVIDNFNKQTQQRLHEYDDRMIEKRKQCKDQCDKEIQKIILKDKIEKELSQHLSTLETNIDTNDIPTCVCEKSVADKVEKTCLKCAGVLGGGVAPGWGLISGIVYTGWKTAALAAATKEAIAEGLAAGEAAGIKEGIDAVILGLNSEFGLSTQAVQKIGLVINGTNYTNVSNITTAIYTKFQMSSCLPHVAGAGAITVSGPGPVRPTDPSFCSSVLNKAFSRSISIKDSVSMKTFIESNVESIVSEAKTTVGRTIETVTKNATTTLTAQKTGVVQTTYMGYQTPIIASVVAILIIVLIMVIIYLILRYRRKKKMKKKHQYIKLLTE
ncbi:hypothetical protein PFBG_00013 [Plasmodium falciparum 7G8]|uniref:Rifin n=1 Tax=Plasmodium falciparum (isolate 7G8) TaxID=57266 RepID=W7FFC7_PLAF8|nr:hypothetical protein PFBG_00013 [Plasmodium falciparum 7G8]